MDSKITLDDFGLPENENDPVPILRGEPFVLPTYDMVSNPTMRIADIQRRRFNIIDHAQESVRQATQAQEDAAIFAALDAMSATPNANGDIFPNLGAVMAAPIRRTLDYQGIGRRIFDIQVMPDGAIPLITTREFEREYQAVWPEEE